MNRIISAFLEVLPAAVVLVPIFYAFHILRFQNGKKSIAYCVFALYLAAVWALVGLPNVLYVRFDLNLNLMPFAGMIADFKNAVLNVLLFVPLGVLLPVLWEAYRSGKRTILFGFGMSLAIELLQMLTLRATDVNDLITNTLGTALGYVLAKLLVKKSPAIAALAGKKTGDLWIVCAVTFGLMFFIYPVLYNFMWYLIF